MNCDKDKVLLFWADELSDDEMESVRRHLLKCPECRNEFIEMLELSADYNNIEDEPAPRDFVAEAARQTRGGKLLKMKAFKKPLVLFPSLSGLAAAAAVMLVLYSPWAPDTAPSVHDNGATVSEPALITYSTVKKHMRSGSIMPRKQHFVAKDALQTRAVSLKTKVRMAKRNLKLI